MSITDKILKDWTSEVSRTVCNKLSTTYGWEVQHEDFKLLKDCLELTLKDHVDVLKLINSRVNQIDIEIDNLIKEKGELLKKSKS